MVFRGVLCVCVCVWEGGQVGWEGYHVSSSRETIGIIGGDAVMKNK